LLGIIIEVKAAFEVCPEVVFKGHFCNKNIEVKAWS